MRCCGYTITFEKKGMEDVLFIKKNVYMYSNGPQIGSAEVCKLSQIFSLFLVFVSS